MRDESVEYDPTYYSIYFKKPVLLATGTTTFSIIIAYDLTLQYALSDNENDSSVLAAWLYAGILSLWVFTVVYFIIRRRVNLVFNEADLQSAGESQVIEYEPRRERLVERLGEYQSKIFGRSVDILIDVASFLVMYAFVTALPTTVSSDWEWLLFFLVSLYNNWLYVFDLV